MTNQNSHQRGGAASLSLKKAAGTLSTCQYFLADFVLLTLVVASSVMEGLR